MRIDVKQELNYTQSINLTFTLEGEIPTIVAVNYNNNEIARFVVKYKMGDTKRMIKYILFMLSRYKGGLDEYPEIKEVYDYIKEELTEITVNNM